MNNLFFLLDSSALHNFASLYIVQALKLPVTKYKRDAGEVAKWQHTNIQHTILALCPIPWLSSGKNLILCGGNC